MTQQQQNWTPDQARQANGVGAFADPRIPIRKPPMRHSAVIGLGLTLGALSAVLTGLVANGGPVTPATTHTVRYDAEADAATGSGRTGMVTAQTADGGTSQGVGPLPYSNVLDGFHAGDFVYISVQNQQGAGTVTCRITVDGVVVSENTSSGGYTIATCQGTVPR